MALPLGRVDGGRVVSVAEAEPVAESVEVVVRARRGEALAHRGLEPHGQDLLSQRGARELRFLSVPKCKGRFQTHVDLERERKIET